MGAKIIDVPRSIGRTQVSICDVTRSRQSGFAFIDHYGTLITIFDDDTPLGAGYFTMVYPVVL